MIQWVNKERTLLVRMWDNGTVEVAMRETPDHTWSPPITVELEK